MSRFFREWGRVWVAPLKLFGGLHVVINWGLALLAIGGISAAVSALWDSSLSLPWLVPIVLVVLFVYSFFVTIVLAWEKSQGPSIEIGPLQLGGGVGVFGGQATGVGVFFVLVKNGPTPSKVRLRVVSVVDSFGTNHIGRPWEGHWRDRPTSFDGEMDAHDEAQYGLLGVSMFRSGNPTLFIYSKDAAGRPTNEHTPVTVSRDVPLHEQGVTTLGVACIAEAGEARKTQRLTMSIMPDPGSQFGYKAASAVQKAKNPVWRKAWKHAAYLFGCGKRRRLNPRRR